MFSSPQKKAMIYILLSIIIVGAIAILGCDMAVRMASNGKTYTDVRKIPRRETALLLGTNPIGRTGRPNQFFLRRLDATEKLYKAGKIDVIIISGAARDDGYDEPKSMRDALMKRGIPQNAFILDREGFRTINSILRAKKVYSADSVTVISQQFHNQRALFLARHSGLDAIAFNAENTSSRKWRLSMRIREYLARVKAVIEILLSQANKSDSLKE